jgi:hypothetical protein
MNTIKLGTIVAVSALLLGVSASSAFAATNVTVGPNNGAFSDNTVKVKNVNSKTVVQSNKSKVTNVVKSKANSGKNTSSFNTGGGSAVVAGPATSTVVVGVGGSSNTANLDSDCGCVGGNTNVTVAGNGAFSDNTVKVENKNWLTVVQSNVSSVFNAVSSSANSGNNSSSFNTGGDSGVVTSAATSDVTVVVEGSSNTLNQ